MQKTLKKSFEINDIGLHSGHLVRMVVKPGLVNSGIIFIRKDVSDRNNVIPARWDNVVDTRLCTVIGNKEGVSVGTIEHLMAALRGCDIDNAIVELDAPEVPVMDGSSTAFVEAIEAVGVKKQDRPRHYIRVLKPVQITKDGKTISLTPSEKSLFNAEIIYDHPRIGTQSHSIELLNGSFKKELAQARTFGLLKDVEALRSSGLGLGGSLDNAIVLDDVSVLNKDGLRFNNEFIRHKILDAIGDLYLAGMPILGCYNASCAGHALNNQILHVLFSDERNWDVVTLESLMPSMSSLRPQNSFIQENSLA